MQTTALILAACAVFLIPASAQQKAADWPAYNGRTDGDHYSALSQIDRANVNKLKVAWQYDTGESGGLQTNPLIVDGVVYGYTPSQKVVALDAATGKLLWKFDSGVPASQPARGFAWWTDGSSKRLFAGVMNYLYALDPATGKPIAEFGEGGRIDLRKGLGKGQPENYEAQSIALTTPGLVYKDVIVTGGREPEASPAPPGDIRAFDVRTGQLRWTFHTIPHPGETGYETWPADAWKTIGAANNWAGMTLDAKRGILYVPTGSAVSDFYGGDRVGNDLYSDSLLALDATTGKRIWSFQGVHHDIWDRDFPSPPALVTVMRNGKRIDAVAQTTKQGYLYLFDRVSGAPLFPIEEVKYPESDVPGEKTSATQPRPVLPAPFARQILTEDMVTSRTPEAHAAVMQAFKDARSAGQFVPLTVSKQTVVLPGFDGGAEWGGPAVDAAHAVLYVNANEMAWLGSLIKNEPAKSAGAAVYQGQCSGCHGAGRAGAPPAFPSLIDVDKRLTAEQITATIHQGKGRMPAFPGVAGDQLKALLEYLRTGDAAAGTGPSDKVEMAGSDVGAPAYRFNGYTKFMDADGYPAITPPWGTLNAIDLNTGRYLWRIPFGEYPALAAKGVATTGSENYGGPILTAGGVLFIGATVYDRTFHAYDSSNGHLLWKTELPFAGVATPATYMLNGKQYVVIACGGGRDHASPSGGVYVAFALP